MKNIDGFPITTYPETNDMRVTQSGLPECLIIDPQVFVDDRGHFMESYHSLRYKQIGIADEFVQDNISVSRKYVVRGLHFQYPDSQGKMLSVLHGAAQSVAVDIRVGSPRFGRWTEVHLVGGSEPRQFYIPAGFAHGFCSLQEDTMLNYKCSSYYDPSSEYTILWNDPNLDITWPVKDPILSQKDASAQPLSLINSEVLPNFAEISNDQ